MPGGSGLILGTRAVLLSFGILFLIFTIGVLEIKDYKDFNILYLLISFLVSAPLAVIYHKLVCR